MTPSVRLETCGGVLSTVDMMVQRRDGPRWLRDDDNDDIEYRRLSNESSKPYAKLFDAVRPRQLLDKEPRISMY